VRTTSSNVSVEETSSMLKKFKQHYMYIQFSIVSQLHVGHENCRNKITEEEHSWFPCSRDIITNVQQDTTKAQSIKKLCEYSLPCTM
jgi:hypothetical protein